VLACLVRRLSKKKALAGGNRKRNKKKGLLGSGNVDYDNKVSLVLRAHGRAINPLTEEAGYLQETYVCPWGG
jgi:hypothetical protein